MHKARSVYDNGKFARTLQEAFGPYAELHVDRRNFLERHIGKVLGAFVLGIIGLFFVLGPL